MEKPILFSTPMVKAIIAGKKTMTRRVIKDKVFQQWQDVGFSSDFIKRPDNNWIEKCPYGQVGDILWVRETWNMLPANDRAGIPTDYWYRADDKSENPDDRWRPSIFMPRVAARLFLKVTNIRVERLRDITEEDAIAEGVLWNRAKKINELEKSNNIINNAKTLFMRLWDSINSKRGYGWDINPWVWVVEFERVQE